MFFVLEMKHNYKEIKLKIPIFKKFKFFDLFKAENF